MMSNIKFNCPQCGQHLSVDAAVAGITAACPECVQAILVPQMTRIVPQMENPKQTKWALVAVGVGLVALLAVGVLI